MKALNFECQRVSKCPLKMRLSATFRVVITLMVGVTWFALSNHCGIASAAVVKASQAHSCCENNHPPPNAPSNGGEEQGIACCKAHPAISATGNVAPGDQTSFAGMTSSEVCSFLPDNASGTGNWELDTGPPSANSFAETVLQRSILAHGPPSLA